ncbi:doublecortin domain-containing protein 2 isoform X1 [Bufo gargarizans]|uniref:doublecortin domain-containing protein 2 isoform X1 n=1 Tax=Bufo gargarizans TaxID=30331 RepID=UPI001CF5857A|nr:doublecortin domain-containing protein 2 isoform X1 [Bufo gargarizans]
MLEGSTETQLQHLDSPESPAGIDTISVHLSAGVMEPVPAAVNGGRSLAPLVQQPAVKAVHVYRNGDLFYRGRRMLIHEKRVGSFDIFLKDVTGKVQAPFGAVRNIYTPRHGHRVTSLEELQPGEYYVAGGKESFKRLDYIHIGENKKKSVDPMSQVKPVSHSRINVSARFRKNLQEPCTVFLIANGDIMNPVVRLLIPRKVLDQWELVLALVTDKVKLRSGAVHRLYTLEGVPIQDGSELENGQFYVAVGREKFKKLPYSDLIFTKSSVRRAQGSKASSLPPINGYRKSKENRQERHVKSTGGSADTVENLISPQPPKTKAKRNPEPHVLHKPVRVKQKKTIIMNNNVEYQENDDGIFKAGEDRSEMWGASEVQEDENTKVEVPVDQRVAETVEEEVQDNEGQEDEETAEDAKEQEDDHNNVQEDHLHEEETSENEEHGMVSHEGEANNGKMHNDSEDVIDNYGDGHWEEDQQLHSVDTHGEGIGQINNDIYGREEDEDHDGDRTDQSQAEYSLPRPTSSRLLEKVSTPSEDEKKEFVAAV